MKLTVVLALSVLALPVYAQQSAQPQLTTQQQDFQKRYESLQFQYNLYHQDLEHITEFNKLEDISKQIQELQKEYQASQQAAQKPNPAVAPAKK